MVPFLTKKKSFNRSFPNGMGSLIVDDVENQIIEVDDTVVSRVDERLQQITFNELKEMKLSELYVYQNQLINANKFNIRITILAMDKNYSKKKNEINTKDENMNVLLPESANKAVELSYEFLLPLFCGPVSADGYNSPTVTVETTRIFPGFPNLSKNQSNRLMSIFVSIPININLEKT